MVCLILRTLCMVGTLGLISPGPVADSYEPRVGQRHPDFSLPSIHDGTPVSLSQFRGRKVLLIQFAAWFCGPSRASMKTRQRQPHHGAGPTGR